MKLLDVDWATVLSNVLTWDELPADTRALALETFRSSGGASVAALGDSVDELRGAGIVVDASSTGKRIGVADDWKETLRVLRAMERLRIWQFPTPEMLIRYLQEHFTTDDARAFGEPYGPPYSYANRQTIALIVESEEWVTGFLACRNKEDASEWARRRSGRSAPPTFTSSEVFDATRSLVQLGVQETGGTPLADLPAQLSGVALPVLADALHTALRFLLVYAGSDGDGVPRIGVWPGIVERLNRPAPRPPAAATPEQTFHSAWLMEDVTALLIAASAEPLRMRGNDYRIFARTQQQIAERLLTIPGWLAPVLGTDVESRVGSAGEVLRLLKLAEAAGVAGTDLRLVPTRAGKKWLALSDHDRLAALIDRLRRAPERNPGSWYSSDEGWSFFPHRLGFDLPGKEWDLRRSLSDAFLSLPSEGAVPLGEWVRFQSEAANPFLVRGEMPRRGSFGWGRPARPEDWERLWADFLTGFLAMRLAPLGGARLGLLPNGTVGFGLTGAGRYLLGAAEEFEYGFEGTAEIIVQPNFEVVFLAPSPQAEAQLGRFAERIGSGVGATFRITRGSTLAAAEAGMTASALVDTLRTVSAREVPANVERQIQDWFRGVRQVRTRRALLVECPDEETASRVISAAGKRVRAITPTLLELADSTTKARSALVRQLRAGGIFVDS